MMHFCMSDPEGSFYEEAIDTVSLLVYYGSIRDQYGRTVSKALWDLYPLIIHS